MCNKGADPVEPVVEPSAEPSPEPSPEPSVSPTPVVFCTISDATPVVSQEAEPTSINFLTISDQGGDYQYAAQQFTLSADSTNIYSITVRLKQVVSPGTATLSVFSTQPSGTTAPSAITNSEVTVSNISSANGVGADYEFVFSEHLTLLGGVYYFSLGFPTSAGTAYSVLYGTSTPYTSGIAYYKAVGGSWNTSWGNTRDLVFKVNQCGN